MIKDYLHLVLGTGRKQTSYKLYYFKAILEFIKKDNYVIPFHNIACMMIASSYFDMNRYANYKRTNDRLMFMKSTLISELDYYGNESISLIYDDLLGIDNNKVNKEIDSLVLYVPYLFLSYGQWKAELEGLVVQKRNYKIEALSQENKSLNLYWIKDKTIYLNERFVEELKKDIEIIEINVNDLIQKYFLG